MEEQRELIDLLASELAQWMAFLPSQEDIVLYVHRFPEEQRALLPELADALLDILRTQRREVIGHQFKGNLLTVLDELSLLEFLKNCSQYRVDSVIQNYQKRFPLLQVQANSIDAEELEEEVAVWERTLYFLAALQWDAKVVHVRTLLSFKLEAEQYTQLHEHLERSIQELGSAYLRVGPEQPNLDPVVAKNVRTTLEELGFLPAEIIDNMLKVSETPKLYSLLSDLSFAARVVSLGVDMKLRPEDSVSFENLLLSELKDEIETQVYAQSVVDPEVIKSSSPFYKLFADTLTLQKLRNHNVKSELTSFRNSLPESEKAAFFSTYRDYCEHSVIVSSLLEPLAVDTIFENLVSAASQERYTYVRSLQPYLNPVFWPIIEEFLLVTVDLI